MNIVEVGWNRSVKQNNTIEQDVGKTLSILLYEYIADMEKQRADKMLIEHCCKQQEGIEYRFHCAGPGLHANGFITRSDGLVLLSSCTLRNEQRVNWRGLEEAVEGFQLFNINIHRLVPRHLGKMLGINWE